MTGRLDPRLVAALTVMGILLALRLPAGAEAERFRQEIRSEILARISSVRSCPGWEISHRAVPPRSLARPVTSLAEIVGGTFLDVASRAGSGDPLIRGMLVAGSSGETYGWSQGEQGFEPEMKSAILPQIENAGQKAAHEGQAVITASVDLSERVRSLVCPALTAHASEGAASDPVMPRGSVAVLSADLLSGPPNAWWFTLLGILLLVLAGALAWLLWRRRAQLGQLLAERTAELRESEAKYRTLVQNVNSIILRIDREGTVAFINEYGIEFFGYSQEEIVGKNVVGTIVPRTDTSGRDLEAMVKDALANPERYVTNENENTRKNSERVWVAWTNKAVPDKSGRLGELLCVGNDITALKRAEFALRTAHDQLERRVEERTSQLKRLNEELLSEVAERRRAEKALIKTKQAAETANRAKSEFLAKMTHEIRTPINGILGMAELALSTPLTPEQRDYLETVRLSADSLLALVNDVLDFSRIEAGKVELKPAPFNLHDRIENTMATLAMEARRKGLEIACRIDPGVPRVVVGDGNQLHQVLANLVNNAIKYTDRGEVVVRVTTVSKTGDEVTLRFSVTDTGVGIPPDKHEEIFGAFEQLDESRNEGRGGTGLGLAVASQLVRLMGGALGLESDPGKGSTFHFEVRVTVHPAAPGEEPGPPSELKDLRVLVVDDNATTRSIVVEMLQEWAVVPAAGNNAAAALVLLESAHESGQPFSCAVIDHHMPDVDGFELVRRIKKDPRFTNIRVVMLGSVGLTDDFRRSEDLGIEAYLAKPIRRSALCTALVQAAKESASETNLPIPKGPPSMNRTSQPRRILVAEDNVVNQKLARKMLEKMGHAVTVTENGLGALEAAKNRTCDLILMDIQMPEMDGLEATIAIRELEKPGSRRIPIIAMTAYATQEDEETCLSSGMDAYITKPIRAGELFQAIEMLGGNSGLQNE